MTLQHSTQRLVYFLRLGRPLHLVGGVVFNALGIAVAAYLGARIDWTAAILGQVAITAIQLMTHYSNDYFDQDADQAAVIVTRWAGGSRVLPDNLLPPRAALWAAVALTGMALLATAILALLSSAPATTALLLLLALFLAWSYSSPPLYLNRRGWGEATGALLVPVLTTLVGYQLQAGALSPLPVLTAVPLGCFQFAMLLSVNFPDEMGDASVGKRTLVVKYGGRRASRIFVAALVLAYALLPALVAMGLPTLVAAAVLATLPLAAWQAWRVIQGAWANPLAWDSLGFWSIGLIMATAGLELAAYVVLT